MGCGCGRRAGIERALCLCLGVGHGGEVGGVERKLAERVGQSLKHSFKKVFVSHAQLAHFSTLAKEKHMLLILNFSTLTFITNARTTMPFARLHSQMVCTQSEPAEIPQHMFVQVGGDRKWRTSRTTLRTPTPLVIRDCFLVNCARTR